MRFFITVFLLGLISIKLLSQEPLEVFGYVQPYFMHFSSKYGDPIPSDDEQFNNMGVSQLNLFFKKSLGDDLSAFVNFELINNYSSNLGFGSFNLQEAYLGWNYSDYLKVKFGMSIPKFNQLYEVYNRTPLLPYILRPKLYEANQGNTVNIFEFLPQKSLLHLNGILPIGPVKLDYAAYINYPTNGFFASKENDLIPGYVPYGQSAVDFLGFGGRVGLKGDFFNLGASIGTDKENKRNYRADIAKKYSGTMDEERKNRYLNDTLSIGDVSRFRLGLDFSIDFAGFTLLAEYLKLTGDLDAERKNLMTIWNEEDPEYIGSSFDKDYYMVMLQYYFTDQLYAFAIYDHLNDNADPYFFGVEGYGGFGFGGGYNINDYVVVKAQYNQNKAVFDFFAIDTNNDGEVTKGEDLRDFIDTWITFGFSLSF